ncbi:MAG: hypothetical protein B9S38_02450 [Verrucomicrobiia bacterium Tous-C4TDCM]|nr:MAG: hypothetical protein B9S38_02450 [Verrucomicrobiae bacterium Tous-C4TDCM]
MSFWDTIVSSIMTGASAGTAGRKGLVPIPAAGDQDKQLHGDGTWRASTSSLAATDAQAAAGASGSTFVTPANTGHAAAPAVNPRAPAQGLMLMDSVLAGPSFSLPAFGTADFTVMCWATIRAGMGNTTLIGAANLGFELTTNSSTTLLPTTYKKNTGITNTGTAVLPTGEMVQLTYVRAAGVGTFYMNGVAAGSAADTNDYSGAVTNLGASSAGGSNRGYIRAVVYNYGLTQAQNRERYEAGGPLGEDYNSAPLPNTALNTGTALNTYATAWGTFTGASASGFTASDTTENKTSIRVIFPLSATLVVGRRYRVRGTATFAELTLVQLQQSDASHAGLGVISSLASSGAFELTFTAVAGVNHLMFNCTTSANDLAHTLTVSGLVVDTPGACFAPELSAPGNGFQWRDMSGNRYDVLLPVTGVAWAICDCRPNSFRQVFTYAAAFDARYLGSAAHAIIPPGGVLREISVKASAATSGTGVRLSSANTLGQWTGSQTFTAGQKRLMTLTNRLPASPAATNDRNVYLVPDSANYTGTVEVEALYDITEGT